MLLATYFLSAFTHTEKVKRSLQKKAIDMMHSFLSAALGDVDVAAFGASRSDAVSSSSASAAWKKSVIINAWRKKKTPKIAASVAFVLQVVWWSEWVAEGVVFGWGVGSRSSGWPPLMNTLVDRCLMPLSNLRKVLKSRI